LIVIIDFDLSDISSGAEKACHDPPVPFSGPAQALFKANAGGVFQVPLRQSNIRE